MNIAEWLARRAATDPGRAALFSGTRCVADYGAFHARAGRIAGWLGAQGIGAGDRVALVLHNQPDYLTLLFGIWYAGAAAVPVNARLHGREVAFILGDAGARLCFVSPALAGGIADATGCAVHAVHPDLLSEIDSAPQVASPAPRDPQDLAWLFYTSGTTGRPKGVMITHRMLTVMSLAYATDVDRPDACDAVLYAAPMSHGAGIYAMLHVLCGARHVCPESGGFDPAEIFALARHHDNIQMFAAPTMVRRLTDVARETGQSGQGLRTVIYAGGPMYQADILDAVDTFGAIFVQVYGQGECPMAITALSRHDVADRSHPRWRERLGSVGRAQSAVRLRIGDADGAPLPPGTVGEVMVQGDPVMPGYWQNPEGSADALRGGWLWTGDMGALDEDGYLTLHDRSKDMIISGGSNIYPREVEEVLLSHPQVQEVSVVGRPHPDWGEEVVAFVVGDAPDAALDQLCLEQIARFKRPRTYLRLSELPKNNYGKVLKTELRARLAADDAP
ncbi:MAG: AMP-binding protein [Marinibacterium sp.]|nr:AMP-binding protein [Marinibacterium sp.]